MEAFEKELAELLNKHSIENVADVPDFLLAGMICRMIEAMGPSIKKTLDWHGCKRVCHPSPNARPHAEAVADSVQADVRCDHSSPLCTDCNHRHPHTICTLETTPRSRPPCDQSATCKRAGLVVRCTPNAGLDRQKEAR